MTNHLIPDCLVQLVHSTCRLSTPLVFWAKVHGQRVAARIVVVDLVLRIAGRHGDASLSTLATADQATQQITFGSHVTRTEARIHFMQSLRACPDVRIDNRRDSHTNPLRGRTKLDQGTVPGGLLGGLRLPGDIRVPVVVEGPCVRRLPQHVADGRGRPVLARLRGWNARLDEPNSDLAHRQAFTYVQIEDQSNDLSFRLTNLKPAEQAI